MKKKFKFGVIGAGFMSTAIVQGVLNAKVLSPSEVIVSDLNEDALQRISKIGVSTTTDNLFLCDNSEFVLFAVKPQSFSEVSSQIKDTNCNKFISIMAGVKKQRIKSAFSNAVLVARAMPNTPCSLSSGAIGVDLSDFASLVEDKSFIERLFSSIGVVVSVSEDLLGAVTGVSGSSPAYFYLFLKGIVDAGVKNGLDYNDAIKLATATMVGAGKMVESNPDKSLDDLINAVCSKGGTTIQAVNLYNDLGLSEITKKAVDACINRSKELENL